MGMGVQQNRFNRNVIYALSTQIRREEQISCLWEREGIVEVGINAIDFQLNSGQRLKYTQRYFYISLCIELITLTIDSDVLTFLKCIISTLVMTKWMRKYFDHYFFWMTLEQNPVFSHWKKIKINSIPTILRWEFLIHRFKAKIKTYFFNFSWMNKYS